MTLCEYNDGTENAVSDVDDTLKLHGEVRLGLEVVEYIVAFALVVDLVSELSLAPLVDVG